MRPPTTLNNREQPSAELSKQKVSGLPGAVHFYPNDAQLLADWANANHIGELSMWELPRDLTGTLGAVDAVNGSGVTQTPFEFSKIFDGTQTAATST